MGSGGLIVSHEDLLIIYIQLLATVTLNRKPLQYVLVISTQTISFIK